MELPVHITQSLAADVRVNLRRADAGVAKQFLDHAQIGAVLEQVRGEAVTEHVWRDVLTDARQSHAPLDPQPHRCVREGGAAPVPEIMIPLVATRRELELMRTVVVQTAERVFNERKAQVEYLVGTMIELPRAALRAGEIAEEAEFFSFGTNDLTQTALGISRDDASRFLKIYEEKGIYEKDPFVSIDRDGVGELVKIGCERGRAARPRIKLGVCGEHGGDPASIYFFEEAGLDYVSASPFRVPVARLAAAHAALGKKR